MWGLHKLGPGLGIPVQPGFRWRVAAAPTGWSLLSLALFMTNKRGCKPVCVQTAPYKWLLVKVTFEVCLSVLWGGAAGGGVGRPRLAHPGTATEGQAQPPPCRPDHTQDCCGLDRKPP